MEKKFCQDCERTVTQITSLSDPGVEIFSSLTEAQLCDRRLVEHDLFIAESGKVIDVALDAGYEPYAMLTEEKHLTGIAAGVVSKVGDIPIYVGSHELLKQLTGFPMTRCVLCAMRRPKLPSVADVLSSYTQRDKRDKNNNDLPNCNTWKS